MKHSNSLFTYNVKKVVVNMSKQNMVGITISTRSLMYRSTISTLWLLLRMELTKKLGEQFLAALQIINSLVRFRSGFKAAVAGANLVNNRTFQSREL